MKEDVTKILVKELKGKLDEKEIESSIEIPPNPEMGDFAFPCFKLAGAFKRNPVEIAKDLSKKLKAIGSIEKITANGPYLNFFSSKKEIAEIILKINEDYGKVKEGKKEKIILEHTSINPNASPHVGRARNSIIGDSVKRILQFQGHNVETHYYINDVSKQVAMLALVFKSTDDFDDLLKKYVDISKKIEKNKKLEEKVFELLHKFEHKDKETVELFNKIVETATSGQKKIFSSMGIDFDYFDYESKYIEEGKHILKELDATGKMFKDKEGRMVLNQKGTGLEWRMKAPVLVLTRNDGTGLYVLRDLAYTIEKCSKGKNILVLGEDQKLYFEQLKHALILLKKPYPDVVHYSFVLLKGKGKMSTRKGEVVLLEELLKEAKEKATAEIKKRKTKGDAMKIAVAAVKYAMLRNDNDKNITFDTEASLNFEGETGPYLQYSYARANSILKKAKDKTETKKVKIPEKLEETEIALIKKINDFPETIENAAKHFSPSIIANYSFKLAQAFSDFYSNCKVIDSKEEAFRLKLVNAFRITIRNALDLLGIEVMNEM